MLLSDVLAIKGKTLYSISPHKSLAEAFALMSEIDVGSLVVLEDRQLLGLFTFREAIAAVHKAGVHWQDVSVAEAMLKNPAVGDPAMNLHELRMHMIDHHQRYLPVLENGLLQGLVSFHDVARAVLEEQGFEGLVLKNQLHQLPVEVMPVGRNSEYSSER